jgi:ATP-dependent DNA ligase
LELHGPGFATNEVFDDGRALFEAVCRLGYEGIVAKNHASVYRAGERGWIKQKNPGYWRRDAELEAMKRSRDTGT